MDNAWTEIQRALAQARATNAAADMHAENMVRLLDGRLRTVKGYPGVRALARLKRELRDFDIRTSTWKQP